MLRLAFLLFPSLTSLLWTAILLFKEDKTTSQKIMVSLLVFTTIYFYVDAHYLMFNPTLTDYVTLIKLDIGAQFITLLLPPLLFMYIRALAGKPVNVWYTYVSFLPAAMLGSASLMIYGQMGIENAAKYVASIDANNGTAVGFDEPMYKMHEIVCQGIYNITLLIELILVTTYIITLISNNKFDFGKIGSFNKNKHKASTLNVSGFLFALFLMVCCIRIVLGRTFLIEHSYISAGLSLILTASILSIGYISVWFPDRKFSMWDLRHPTVIADDQEFIEAPEDGELPKSPQNSLLESFNAYIEAQKPYLDPELSINDVARDLFTNRTYISVLINKHFEMSFRSFINSLRIEAAKELMRQEPNTPLVQIAERSGFVSDSQLVKKFKEVEGIPPRDWQRTTSI